MRKLLIRADASTEIGTGHLMRCLALAQAWHAEGGRVTFLSRCDSPALRRRVRDEGARLVSLTGAHPNPADWQATSRFIGRLKPDWVVLDGYHFGPDYQKAARVAGTRVMVIDDMAHWPEYHADILLNQNLGAEKLQYRCDRDTEQLLGTRYVLLRNEFLKWRGWQRKIPQEARKVLVTMGGSDPDNVTLKVVHALEKVPFDGLEVVVVIGTSNPHCHILRAEIRSPKFKVHHHKLRLICNPLSMPELMAWADVAVTAGGSTCWELAFMGVPSLVLVLAANQRASVRGLVARRAAKSLGTFGRLSTIAVVRALATLLRNFRSRHTMSVRGRQLVDGYGADRVLMNMRGAKLRLRSAQLQDARLLWRWASDPDTRRVSFSSARIPWQSHLVWLDAKLRDPRSRLYVGVAADEQPVGQVRADLKGRDAVISVSVDRDLRRKGYGCELIREAVDRLLRDARVGTIKAFVKPDNLASVSAFAKAGFRTAGTPRVEGQTAILMIMRRRRTAA
jgi:UDP-2,4-diacetamido-2,4,6-trideoxy-beta-L-altropyranose hydrolase